MSYSLSYICLHFFLFSFIRKLLLGCQNQWVQCTICHFYVIEDKPKMVNAPEGLIMCEDHA